jgi:hypothetical protein
VRAAEDVVVDDDDDDDDDSLLDEVNHIGLDGQRNVKALTAQLTGILN